MTEYDRFLNAVHSRLAIVRAAEHFGWCILAGSAISFPLLLIGMWLNQSALPLLMVIAAMCILIAAAWTIGAWPSKQSAAAEADRQLNLADLLVTALQLKHKDPSKPTDLFTDAVLAMANARCANLSPSTVALNRLGIRGWSGIGLSAALVLALVVLPLQPQRSDAYNVSSSPLLTAESKQPGIDAATDALHRNAGAIPAPRNDATNDDANRVSASSVNAGDHSNQQNPSTSNLHSIPGAGQEPAGGSATTSQASPNPIPQHLSTDAAPSSHIPTAPLAGGGSAANNINSNHGATTGFLTSQQKTSRSIPPWQTPDWPAAGNSANIAITNGQVPPAYRDLVKDYFNTPFQNP